MEMKLDLLELKGKSERNLRGWKIDEHGPADSLKKRIMVYFETLSISGSKRVPPA